MRPSRLSGCAQRDERGEAVPCRAAAPRARDRLRSCFGEFPPRSRKRAREAPQRVRRKESSLRPLDSLVHGGVVLMNHVELGGEAEKTLGVADEKVAIGIQTAMELVDEALLLRLVEIDHHVAAEDDVVVLRQEF